MTHIEGAKGFQMPLITGSLEASIRHKPSRGYLKPFKIITVPVFMRSSMNLVKASTKFWGSCIL